MSLYSYQVEKHFLGGLIQNPEVFTEIDTFVTDRTFKSELHGIIFSCFRSSFLNHEKIDKVLLAQKIKNLNISFKDNVDIFSYIEAISFTQINAKATIDAAKELAKLKGLRDIEDTTDKIKLHINQNANDNFSKIVTDVDSIYASSLSAFDGIEEPHSLLEDILDLVEQRGNNPIEEIGIKTPFSEFNRLYGGLRDGNIYAVASRPKQGKTTFLNYLAIETAILNNIPVLMLDTEMSSEEIKFRTAAAFSGVPLWYLETGKWRHKEEYVDKVRNYLKNINKKAKVWHYYVGNRTVDDVCSIIRRWYLSVVGRGNKCLVVYDYLKLTGEKMDKNWAEHQALGEKVDKFKRIASELHFPFFTAIQLNRSGENTGKSADDITDDSSAISLSDRLSWFATYVGIFRRKVEEEISLDTRESGTHKLIEVVARFQGRDAVGHQDRILRSFPSTGGQMKKKYVKNFINYEINNFGIKELGSLKDCIARQNAKFLIKDSENPDEGETKIKEVNLDTL